MTYSLRPVGPPLFPVVTKADMYLQCRLDPDFNLGGSPGSPVERADDHLIQTGIDAAVSELWGPDGQGWLGTPLTTQEFELGLEQLPRDRSSLTLPYGPVSELGAVTYLDGDGVTVTVDPADFVLKRKVPPNRSWVDLAFGKSWPSGSRRIFSDSAKVRFKAGYGEAKDVPAIIRMWIMQRAATFYEIREGIVVGTITSTVPTYADALENYRMRGTYCP